MLLNHLQRLVTRSHGVDIGWQLRQQLQEVQALRRSDSSLACPDPQYIEFERITPVKTEGRVTRNSKTSVKKCFIFDKVEDKDWMMDDTAQGSDPHYLS